MPDLNFQVEGAEPQRFAAAPLLLFKLRVAEAVAAGAAPTPIHAVALRCQVRIEPARRRYERRGAGAAPRPVRHARALGPDAPPDALDARQRRRPAVRRRRPSSTCRCRAASTSAWRPRSTSPPWRGASSRSASSSAARSSTRRTSGALQVAQISWEKEAYFRLPAATWRGLMDLLLPQQRLALPPQGRLRPARPVQEPPGPADLGTGAGAAARRGRGAGDAMNRALVDRSPTPSCTRGTSSTPTGRRSRTASAGPSAASTPRPTAGRRAAATPRATRPNAWSTGRPATTFEAVVRFLHLTARQVGEVDPPLAEWPEGAEPPFRPVEALRVGDELFHDLAGGGGARGRPRRGDAGRARRPARESRPSRSRAGGGRSRCAGAAGEVVGVLVREQQAVAGAVEVAAAEVAEGLFRLTLRVANRTPLEDAGRREPRRGAAPLPGLDARDPRRPRRRVRLAHRPARALARGRRRVPERRHLAGPGRRGGADGHDALVADHPLRLPAGRPREPGRLLRRHRDRRDADAADHDADRRGEGRDGRRRRAGRAPCWRGPRRWRATRCSALHGTVRGLRPVPGEGAHG